MEVLIRILLTAGAELGMATGDERLEHARRNAGLELDKQTKGKKKGAGVRTPMHGCRYTGLTVRRVCDRLVPAYV